jgi:putative endonuclease
VKEPDDIVRVPEWRVYVVECVDGSLYTGITIDVEARVARHNDGEGARYTRSRRPVRLVHVETAADRGAALRREHAIKKLAAVEKRRLVRQPRAE